MSIEHGKILRKSLSFAVNPERWMPIFILDFLAASIALFYFIFNVPVLAALMESTTGFAMFTAIIQTAMVPVFIFIIWMLIRLWFQASIIHQCYREKDYNKSFRIGLSKFPSFLAAVIVIGLIGGLAGAVPFVGFILSILVSFIFFFTYQAIVVNNMGFVDALKKSYRIFRKQAFEVFIIWLLIAIIAMIVGVAFSIPLMVLFFNALVMAWQASSVSFPAMLNYVINLFQAYLPAVILTLIVSLIGFSITTVFSLKAQTEFYLKVKK